MTDDANGFRRIVAAGRTLAQLAAAIPIAVALSGTAFAQVSEIDAYDRAVSTQSVEAARAFLDEFQSSHLAGDLIESLNLDAAREVCAGLRDGGPQAARQACTRLPQAAAKPANNPEPTMAAIQNMAPAAGPPPAAVVKPEVATDEEMMNSGVGAMPASPANSRPASQVVAEGSTPPPQTAAMRGIQIQLLSTKSATDTEKGWTQLQAAYPDLLADLQLEVVRVDLGAAKGVWYRGLAGPVANRDEAKLLCTAIRSRLPHNDCFIAAY